VPAGSIRHAGLTARLQKITADAFRQVEGLVGLVVVQKGLRVANRVTLGNRTPELGPQRLRLV
jgi:hypothetical protein